MNESAGFLRQWRIVRRLAASVGGVGVAELAKVSKVSVKTIRRDLEVLRDAGVALESETGPRGRKLWTITPLNGSSLSLPFDQAAAMFLSLKLMRPWLGTYMGQAYQNAWRKIQAMLPVSAREYLEQLPGLLEVVSTSPRQYATKADILETLMQAAEERVAVNLTYQSQRSTEPVTYEVHPLSIAQYRHSIYLAAFAPHHGEVRNYKLDRIEAAEITTERFERPQDFELSRHLSGAFGIYRGEETELIPVRIHFDREVARYVRENQWHASQQLRNEPDGSLIAEFQLTATEEIKAWIMSFGTKAEVLDPECLRAELAADFRQLAATYAPSEPSPPKRVRRRAK